ncbi:MAG: ABC transporter permease [Firmicutes bacterium]|nr:ABC transporter permease [Bacillota bacterium]
MTDSGVNINSAVISAEESVSPTRRFFIGIQKSGPVLVPLLSLAAMIVLIIYMVNNPGGAIEARILNYGNVLRMFREHITLVLVGSGAAILTSVPLGILITRPAMRRYTPLIDNPVNVAQTVPGLAILALFLTIFGLGFRTAIFALWLYSLLPILRNTSSGIQGIEPGIIEAARGMGMRPWRILIRIELPLALPIIMAGIKTATVVLVGSAALSTFIGAGGLGELIVTGIDLMRPTLIYTGAILSALLAILLDNLLGSLERYLRER